MKNIKSLKSQLVLQFAIIILPMITILLYQTVSDIYHSEALARSYHYLGACHGIKLKYTQFINGAVDAVDTGQLGTDALRALDEAAEMLRNLAQEDHTGNFVTLQGKMDKLLTVLRRDRSITTLMPLRELINQMDAELRTEYLHYEKENWQAIEANITFAKNQKKIVSGAIIFTLLLSIMVGRSITRSITRPITEAVAFTQSIILDSFTELAHGTTHLAQKELAPQEKVKVTGEVQMLVDSINRMAADLEKRTRELLETQEELVRKEKLATLGRLSGSVGHELRNPLGVMSNAIYFLKMVLTEADETTKEYLDIIKQEIETSQRIISDLLDFARTKPPQTKTITANELIGQSIGRCTIPCCVTLQCEVPETLPPLKIDPQQIGQVLQNLITNGIQAMPEGGALKISARRERGTRNEDEKQVRGTRFEERGNQDLNLEPRSSNTDPSFSILDPRFSNPDPRSPILEPYADFVEISVADTGEGISEENMRKLFQSLFTTKAKGIGLGLVVCRNLVEANGGRIGVDSRVNEGTIFTVMLPAEEVKT